MFAHSELAFFPDLAVHPQPEFFHEHWPGDCQREKGEIKIAYRINVGQERLRGRENQGALQIMSVYLVKTITE